MFPLPWNLQDWPTQAAACARAAMVCARAAMVSAGLLLAAAILVLVAAGFGIAALYLWLSTLWPDYLAALATAGAPLLAAALLILRVKTMRPRGATVPPPRTPERDLSRAAEQAGAAAARETLSELRSNPAGTLAAALAVGIMAGLFAPKSRD